MLKVDGPSAGQLFSGSSRDRTSRRSSSLAPWLDRAQRELSFPVRRSFWRCLSQELWPFPCRALMDVLSVPGALPVNELLCDFITSCGELCARGSAGQHHGSPLAAQPRAHAPHEARRRRQSCSLRAPRGPIPAQVTETLLLLCINNHGPASQGGPTGALETLVYGVRIARGASEIGPASPVCHVGRVQARSKPAPRAHQARPMCPRRHQRLHGPRRSLMRQDIDNSRTYPASFSTGSHRHCGWTVPAHFLL